MLDLEWFGTLTDVTELIERDEVERAKQQRRKFYLTSFWKGTRVCEDAKDIVRDLLELIQLVLGTDAVAMTVVGENKASGVGEPAEGGSGTNGSAADKGKENESNDVFLVAGVGIDCARLGTALGRSDDKTWFTGAVLQCQEPVLYRKEVRVRLCPWYISLSNLSIFSLSANCPPSSVHSQTNRSGRDRRERCTVLGSGGVPVPKFTNRHVLFPPRNGWSKRKRRKQGSGRITRT